MLAVSARARGEMQHGVGAGRPHSWRLRLGFSPYEACGDRGHVPASRTFAEMFECEASGRDGGPNGWTKKSDVELVEGLHETDNDEQ